MAGVLKYNYNNENEDLIELNKSGKGE